MSSKRLLIIAAACVLLAALTICAVMLISSLNDATPTVALPSPPQQASDPAGDNNETGNGSTLKPVTVTAETVREVVETLSRPESYSRTVTVVNSWDGGSEEYIIKANVSGADASLVIDGAGYEKHVVICGGKLYIWYGSSQSWYEAPCSDIREADEYQMLVVWEDIIELPDGAVSDAGYADRNGESCIFAEYTSGELGYKTVCWISVNSGLVIEASIYDGSAEIYKMTAEPTGDFDATSFILPDGSDALNPA